MGLKINWNIQLLVYLDDINLVDKNMHTLQRKTEAVLTVRKEGGPDADVLYPITEGKETIPL
jgi:hypothetical protein